MPITAAEKHQKILDWFVRWGEARNCIRALILYSSRSNPHARVDAFSDYDILVIVRDIQPFFTNKSYLEDFGRVLTVYKNPIGEHDGFPSFGDITQYEDGTKIDYSIFPVEWLQWAAQAPALPVDLDNGYTVLLDKDHLTGGLKQPTYTAYIPKPPSQAEFTALVEEFYAEAPYVAKNLWRDELIFWKYNLDHVMKFELLRKMIDWRYEIDHNWSAKTGAYGKGLKKRSSPQTWAALECTYTGAGWEENWSALFQTLDLFHTLAREVADHLGYPFPPDLHERVVAYLRKVKSLDRNADVVAF